jgi:hypothetical protein
MHSSETPSGRRYHHNGDFSGEIWINLAANEFAGEIYADAPGGAIAKIPLEDLREIVRAADLQRRLDRLEELR